MPLSVGDLVEHLNMTAAPDPATPRGRELQRALDTATQEVTRMTGLLDAATATARVAMGWETVAALPYRNLTAVGAVTDPGGIVVDPYRVDLEAGIVQLPLATPGTWSIVCTRADPWPAALQTAALEWAAHVYEVQRTTLNPAAEDDVALPSFALPNRVAEFARPYLLPGIA